MLSTNSLYIYVITVAIALPVPLSLAITPTPFSVVPAKALVTNYPRPAYPKEARDKHMTGMAIVALNVDFPTGTVTSAQLLKSTGYKILDDSALEAFRQWRFRPGSVRKVKIPIKFRTKGVFY
jgi:protein TonB